MAMLIPVGGAVEVEDIVYTTMVPATIETVDPTAYSIVLAGATVMGPQDVSTAYRSIETRGPQDVTPGLSIVTVMGRTDVSSAMLSATIRRLAGAFPVYLSASIVAARSMIAGLGSIETVGFGRYAGLLSASVVGPAAYESMGSFSAVKILWSEALNAIEIRTADGFTIISDVIEVGLNPVPTVAGYYPAQDINVIVRVNGTEIPIISFEYQEPEDRLGGMLNVTLAETDRGLVPIGGAVELALVVTDILGGSHEIPMLEDAKLAGRDYMIAWRERGPGDTLTISCIDIMGDRFGQGPRKPVVMFDPAWVKVTDIQVNPRNAIRTEAGVPILPILEPVAGLTLHGILRRAYTGQGGYISSLSPATLALMARVETLINGGESFTIKGLGFGSVVTNIPDYFVNRADFTIEAGWHDGVQPFIGMFGPLFFVMNNVLYVLDAERALPSGFTPRTIPISSFTQLGQSTPYRDPYNAVLVTYQVHEREYPNTFLRPKFETTTEVSGTFGAADFTETTTTTQTNELVDNDTGQVLNSFLQQQIIETRISVRANDGSYVVLLAHRETMNETYEDGLKTGHDKSIEGLLLTGPDRSLLLVPVGSEQCEISWVDDPNRPGQKLQLRNVTQFSALVYNSTDTTSRINPNTGATEDAAVRYPALSAQASSIMTDDGTLSFEPTRTITETLRPVDANTTDVQIVDMDLISGTVRRSISQPRAGQSISNQYQNKSKTVLLRNTASEDDIGPRIPVGLNAGELPYKWAHELGLRLLNRASNPPDTYRLSLPGIDFSANRGSVLRGTQRNGVLTPSILVRGRTITGSNLGQTGHRINMTLTGVTLPVA